MNIEHKLQRLNALRLQRDHVLSEIATLEASIVHDRARHANLTRNVPKRSRSTRPVVHVEPVQPTVQDQDLGSWARRLATVEGL